MFLGLPIIVSVILVITLIVLFVTVECEYPFWATVTIVSSVLLLNYFGTINLSLLPQHLNDVAKYAGLWVVIGIIWTVVKWKFYVDVWAREKQTHIAVLKALFLKYNKISDVKVIPEFLREEWETLINRVTNHGLWPVSEKYDTFDMKKACNELMGATSSDNSDLSLKRNKGRITIWAIYWPWSMAWTLVNDPIKRLYQHILFVWIGGFLNQFAVNAQNRVKDDLRS